MPRRVVAPLLVIAAVLVAASAAGQTTAADKVKALTAADLATALKEKGSVLLPNVRFDPGKAVLTPTAAAALAPVGELLKADPSLRVEIRAHTDSAESKDGGRYLSLDRAVAVSDYLVKTFKIVPDRVAGMGLGDAQPLADNRTEAGRAQNRRVELAKSTVVPSRRGGPGVTEWTGRVITGLMATGGETTGMAIIAGGEQIELQGDAAMRQRLEALDGKTVTVTGTLETRQGVEVRARRIITVTAIK
jgi:outer membrane protein OmpA-like peptidoglycan-associated protein